MSTPYVSKYVKTAPSTITLDRFLEMLNVLPPSRWHRGHVVEWFHVCERLTGNLVAWYMRVGEVYYEFQDDAALTMEQLTAIADDLVLAQIHEIAGPAVG